LTDALARRFPQPAEKFFCFRQKAQTNALMEGGEDNPRLPVFAFSSDVGDLG
jgi:hypothetical protein